jgi:hypothetical protein
MSFAVDEYIVDVDLTYAVEDLVLHTALKVRVSSFLSLSNLCPLV